MFQPKGEQIEPRHKATQTAAASQHNHIQTSNQENKKKKQEPKQEDPEKLGRKPTIKRTPANLKPAISSNLSHSEQKIRRNGPKSSKDGGPSPLTHTHKHTHTDTHNLCIRLSGITPNYVLPVLGLVVRPWISINSC